MVLPESGSAEPPFDRWHQAAALGDALVLTHTAQRDIGNYQSADVLESAAVRLVDGTWVDLPDPPELWASSVIEVGETVAIAGIECSSEPCQSGTLGGALLSRDLERWEPIDFDDGTYPLGDDSGFVRGLPGLLSGPPSGSLYRIDSEGAVVHVPAHAPTEASEMSAQGIQCRAGRDSLVDVELAARPDTSSVTVAPLYGSAVEALPLTEAPSEFTRVMIVDLDEPEAGWAEAPVPDLSVGRGPLVFCGPDGPVIAEPHREIRYEDGEWVEHNPEFLSELADQGAVLGTSASLLDDGTVVLSINRGLQPDADPLASEPEARPSPIFVRHPDGTYENADQTFVVTDGFFTAGNRAYTGRSTAEITELDLPR